MNFTEFKMSVAKQFAMITKQNAVYVVDVNKDELWQTYLGAFPEGTNPMYRERTEHDCNCCKQFIRAVGGVVTIADGKLVTIWDAPVNDPAYQVVSTALSNFVKSKAIYGPFFHFERTAGSNKSFEDTVSGVRTWDHFFVNIPSQFVFDKTYIPTKVGEARSKFDVMFRSLKEIDIDSIEIVIDLINQNTLYRGSENKFSVTEFRKLKNGFNKIASEEEKKNFVWQHLAVTPESVARIRNSAIGTLLTDLSSGVELENAVKSFEAKVAPANYKRPTALVTKKMVEQAKKTIDDLGYTSALERRFANLTDISINNILFANRSTKNVLLGDVFDEISSGVKETKTKKKMDTIEEVHIDKFISDILPRVESVEVMVENNHLNNLVSLVAPLDPSAKSMFKWDNNFSWSYRGDVTDSIKERVKRAGGNVSGDVCCRLAWFNYDDLDLHMIEPGGYEIYFGNRSSRSPSGGRLDVDMNAGSRQSRTPVENIYYSSVSDMREGKYTLFVHNYRRRESVDVGFEVELDIMGETHTFVHEKAVPDGSKVVVVEFTYTKKDGVKITNSIESTSSSKKEWGITTLTFVPVSAIMLSPNYWNTNQVGNKHYFFMLEGCMNDGSARGFYNEFLNSNLDKHRKVLEMVGSKMKTEKSQDQLSGLGFSSTQRNSVVCRVKGSFTRVIKVVF